MMRRGRTEYAAARRDLRHWAAGAWRPEWTEDEWRELLGRAVRQAPEPAVPERAAPLGRPVWAAAAMLAALVSGALFLSLGPRPAAPILPDNRAGEMLPADPKALVSPLFAPNPLLPQPPENPPAWIMLNPGPGPTVFLFLPRLPGPQNRR
jgi:hypothetical protein